MYRYEVDPHWVADRVLAKGRADAERLLTRNDPAEAGPNPVPISAETTVPTPASMPSAFARITPPSPLGSRSGGQAR